MYVHKILCGAAGAAASLLLAGPAGAAMSPALSVGAPVVQHVDCAVGFHIGPLGTCVIGAPDEPPPPPAVIERRGAAEGCETKSVRRSDTEGNTETHTRTDCD
jgi:hypothetical protein